MVDQLDCNPFMPVAAKNITCEFDENFLTKSTRKLIEAKMFNIAHPESLFQIFSKLMNALLPTTFTISRWHL